MKSNSKKKKSKIYKFNAKDFYKILNSQEYRCFLTGRELLPENTNSEHIVPLRKGGNHKLNNICHIVTPLSKLKRYYTEEEIVHLAADIVKWKGEEYGYKQFFKKQRR
ncbi:HNH endonuclease [Leptospira sp. id769339]|uniref:HNH endonuclease n=1 Tax=Leptospira sp. id769339 TaxID=2864221 RepID=UPI00214BF1CB|nr:HNH endonuclease [Leptospira sp. id769339]MCR1795541.1 HNH endonuclease [Leptospira sp. id769339]